MSDFNSEVTYQCISKPIIKCLETQDKGCKGFIKREILTRIMALAISIFQAIDFLRNGACFIGKGTALLADKMGLGFVSKKTLKDYSLKTHAEGMLNNALGVAFGSVCSVLNPRCFVPFFFAPEVDLFKDPVDPTQKYAFDRHFDKTFVINLKTATEKMSIMNKHLNEIGVQNRERFEAIRGSEVTDADLKRWGYNTTIDQLYNRMPGDNLRYKQASVGCFLSHLFAIKKAKAEGLKAVLILEDDAAFPQTRRAKEMFDQSMKQLSSTNWNMLCLGYVHDHAPSRHSQNLDRIESGYNGHAYAVNHTYYDRLIHELENMILDPSRRLLAVDMAYSQLIEKRKCEAYAMRPLIGFQRDGLKSDITGVVNNRWPKIIQATQHIYAYCLAPLLSRIGLPNHRIKEIKYRLLCY